MNQTRGYVDELPGRSVLPSDYYNKMAFFLPSLPFPGSSPPRICQLEPGSLSFSRIPFLRFRGKSARSAKHSGNLDRGILLLTMAKLCSIHSLPPVEFDTRFPQLVILPSKTFSHFTP